MNARLPLLLFALGPVLGACGDRPALGTGSSDSHTGLAGAAGGASAGSGGAGSGDPHTGPAGTTGGASAGSGGADSAGGAGGTGGDVPLKGGCDVKPLVEKYYCTIAGACHDALGSGGGLDMVTAGWEQRLVRGMPITGSGAIPSMCAGQGRVYLVPGSQPARGLFLDKLRQATVPCGSLEPPLGAPVTAQDFDCFQRWADALTAPR